MRVERGETTVTERLGEDTRSRAHAWSSAPCYFLNRIILGVRQTAAGCRSFAISPRLCRGVTHAEGSVATPFGPLHAAWRLEERDLRVQVQAPTDVRVVFKDNGFKDDSVKTNTKEILRNAGIDEIVSV